MDRHKLYHDFGYEVGKVLQALDETNRRSYLKRMTLNRSIEELITVFNEISDKHPEVILENINADVNTEFAFKIVHGSKRGKNTIEVDEKFAFLTGMIGAR